MRTYYMGRHRYPEPDPRDRTPGIQPDLDGPSADEDEFRSAYLDAFMSGDFKEYFDRSHAEYMKEVLCKDRAAEEAGLRLVGSLAQVEDKQVAA